MKKYLFPALMLAAAAVCAKLWGCARQPAVPQPAALLQSPAPAEAKAARKPPPDNAAAETAQHAASDAGDSADSALLEEYRAQQLAATKEQVCLLFRQENWEQAEKDFYSASALLPDGDLEGCLAYALKQAAEAGKTELSERLCEFVLAKHPDKKSARNTAANELLRSAEAAHAKEKIPALLAEFLDLGLEPEFVLSCYHQYFYAVLQCENMDIIKTLLDSGALERTGLFREYVEAVRGMIKIGERLLAAIPRDDRRWPVNALLIQSAMLDGMFMTEDYDGALQLVEHGFTEWEEDEGWRAAAITKIKAHAALKRGEKERAAELFAAFLDSIKNWEDENQKDPLTGIVHTKDMTMGLNARRIGKLLEELGKKAEATQAYVQAREYYTKALNAVSPQSSEAEYIRAELEKIPSGT